MEEGYIVRAVHNTIIVGGDINQITLGLVELVALESILEQFSLTKVLAEGLA